MASFSSSRTSANFFNLSAGCAGRTFRGKAAARISAIEFGTAVIAVRLPDAEASVAASTAAKARTRGYSDYNHRTVRRRRRRSARPLHACASFWQPHTSGFEESAKGSSYMSASSGTVFSASSAVTMSSSFWCQDVRQPHAHARTHRSQNRGIRSKKFAPARVLPLP